MISSAAEDSEDEDGRELMSIQDSAYIKLVYVNRRISSTSCVWYDEKFKMDILHMDATHLLNAVWRATIAKTREAWLGCVGMPLQKVRSVELVVVGGGRASYPSRSGLAQLETGALARPVPSAALRFHAVLRLVMERYARRWSYPRPVPISVLCLQARCPRGWTREGTSVWQRDSRLLPQQDSTRPNAVCFSLRVATAVLEIPDQDRVLTLWHRLARRSGTR